ncbi:MAG: M24 family metallopeptidase [Gemmatimonadaceae bacterium]
MTDRRPARLAALAESLRRANLDGLLVTGLANIQYLTGFSGSSALLVVTQGETLLITDFRYETQVRDEVGDLARIGIDRQSLWSALWRMLAEMGKLDVMGFESAHMVQRDFERLSDGGARWKWRSTSDLVEALRERKDADEIGLIEQAVGVAERALGRTVSSVRAGMTELQVAGILEHALRDEGSEGFPFPTIVASGPRSALPHARSSRRQTGRGEFLLIDFGAVVGGYCADITRTFILGPANSEQREAHDVVKGANERASREVRAGMLGKDADALARSYIEERGQGDRFGHSLGHGIGLEVHEAPRLARTAEGVLPAGAVVTIEPGVYREGWGGVRIEDNVVLEAGSGGGGGGGGGARCLTSFSRELLEIA